MKKFIAIATILFSFSAAVNAQTTVLNATTAYRGTWDAYASKYEWSSANSTNIRFTIQDAYVQVADRAGSTYTTGEQIADRIDSDGGHEFAWKAVDEKGVSCIFKMINYSDGSKLIIVMYTESAYMYVVA
jgi:hypothetical protein